MDSGGSAEAEENVRRLCAAGDIDQATTVALRVYGREVMGFLCAFHKNEAGASDAFSVFAEDLWRSMPAFAWACSLRTWAYMLARRASLRTIRQRKGGDGALASSAISQIVQEVRSETISYLRTEKKTRLRALREKLSEQDQVLLVLRVDRGLAWEELARVLSTDEPDEEGLKREAARLRKRFQLVKEKLKTLAQSEGLYPSREREDR